MDNLKFPALYYAADSLAVSKQRHFFGALILNLVCLVLASALSSFNYPHWSMAAAQVLLLLGTLASTVCIAIERPVRNWYAARALAESVKTLAWKYACRADPFNIDEPAAQELFLRRILMLIEQNAHIARRPPEGAEANQITSSMRKLRESPSDVRAQYYVSQRVQNQLDWYGQKARANERAARGFFILIVVANSLAIIFALLKIHFYDTSAWPTEIFVTLSASLLTWTQAKKFGELSASYGLTTHEIATLRDSAHAVSIESSLSEFISDAENAFSREHTQWIARQDH